MVPSPSGVMALLGSVPRESSQGLPSSLICRQKGMTNSLDVTPYLSHCGVVVLLQQSHNHPLEYRVAAGMLSHSHFASQTKLWAEVMLWPWLRRNIELNLSFFP